MSNSLLALPPECDAIVVDSHTISTRIAELGQEIAEKYDGEQLRLITVLRGGVFFLADLCRAIDMPLHMDFLAVAPYLPGKGGAVRMTKDLEDDISGTRVVLVEDVVDTGLTVNYVLSFLRSHGPASVDVCALFDKPARRIASVSIAMLGFEMPDRFLVGYGLDLAGRYRNLPFVASLNDDFVFGDRAARLR